MVMSLRRKRRERSSGCDSRPGVRNGEGIFRETSPGGLAVLWFCFQEAGIEICVRKSQQSCEMYGFKSFQLQENLMSIS